MPVLKIRETKQIKDGIKCYRNDTFDTGACAHSEKRLLLLRVGFYNSSSLPKSYCDYSTEEFAKQRK